MGRSRALEWSRETLGVVAHGLRLLGTFFWLELLSCLFAIGVFASLAISKVVDIPGLPRYDLVLILCIGIQWAMVKFGLETKDELKVICVFHLIGFALEAYKVSHGSWAYPEPAYLKFFGVPLYSGFMYSSVASYLCQAWRRFDLKMVRLPSPCLALPLGAAIYANFFTHHYLPDLRWAIAVGVLAVYGRTVVKFTVRGEVFSMPLWLSFMFIGLFIWVGENIATFFSAWRYPNQQAGWAVVHTSKISSWFLLVIVSFILVDWLKRRKARG